MSNINCIHSEIEDLLKKYTEKTDLSYLSQYLLKTVTHYSSTSDWIVPQKDGRVFPLIKGARNKAEEALRKTKEELNAVLVADISDFTEYQSEILNTSKVYPLGRTTNPDLLLKMASVIHHYASKWEYEEFYDGNDEMVFHFIKGGPKVADDFLNEFFSLSR